MNKRSKNYFYPTIKSIWKRYKHPKKSVKWFKHKKLAFYQKKYKEGYPKLYKFNSWLGESFTLLYNKRRRSFYKNKI